MDSSKNNATSVRVQAINFMCDSSHSIVKRHCGMQGEMHKTAVSPMMLVSVKHLRERLDFRLWKKPGFELQSTPVFCYTVRV